MARRARRARADERLVGLPAGGAAAVVEVAGVAGRDLGSGQARELARVALAQIGVDDDRPHAEVVGDDRGRLDRPLQVGRPHRVHGAEGAGRLSGLQPAHVGQPGVRLTLPAPLGVPLGLRVADEQHAGGRLRAGGSGAHGHGTLAPRRHYPSRCVPGERRAGAPSAAVPAARGDSSPMALPLDKLGTTYGPVTTVIDGDRAKRLRGGDQRPQPRLRVRQGGARRCSAWCRRGRHAARGRRRHDPARGVPCSSCTASRTCTSTSRSCRDGRSRRRRGRTACGSGGSGTRLTIAGPSARRRAGEPVLDPVRHHVHPRHVRRRVGRARQARPRLPRRRPGEPVGDVLVHVDDDQTYRYRDASGDTMPIHVDDELRQVRRPARHHRPRALHDGDVQPGGDRDGRRRRPRRLQRLAVRFAANVFPGNDVVTTLYEAGSVDGPASTPSRPPARAPLVIKNGRAEVVEPDVAVLRLFAAGPGGGRHRP